MDIKEWPVPWPNTFTRDPYVAPDGRVFFCGMAGNYVGVLDTATGEFKRFELPNPANPHNLIIDAKGIVWYAGNRGAHIGRLDPATGVDPLRLRGLLSQVNTRRRSYMRLYFGPLPPSLGVHRGPTTSVALQSTQFGAFTLSFPSTSSYTPAGQTCA